MGALQKVFVRFLALNELTFIWLFSQDLLFSRFVLDMMYIREQKSNHTSYSLLLLYINHILKLYLQEFYCVPDSLTLTESIKKSYHTLSVRCLKLWQKILYNTRIKKKSFKVISDNLIGSCINLLFMNFYPILIIVIGAFFEESEAEDFHITVNGNIWFFVKNRSALS